MLIFLFAQKARWKLKVISSKMNLNEAELFNRQEKVYPPEIQKRFKSSKVMLIGAGGLGSTVSTVLSRSGIGTLILVDRDVVSVSNLHRQFLYGPNDINKPKVEVAKENSLLFYSKVIPVYMTITSDNADSLFELHSPDVVVDCTDNFEIRTIINQCCAKFLIPLVFGSVTALEGQVSVFCHWTLNSNCPCFSCIHPETPQTGKTPPPVVPVIVSTTATLQATQVLAILSGIGDVLAQELLTFNLAKMVFKKVKLRPRRDNCPVCRKNQTFVPDI
jgi:adenylyltransferase/sulfurtransferase